MSSVVDENTLEILQSEYNSEENKEQKHEFKYNYEMEEVESMAFSFLKTDAKSSTIVKTELLEVIKNDKNLISCFEEKFMSSKFEILLEMLKKVMEDYQNDKIIIFSQWIGVLNNIGSKLKEKGIKYEYIHGQVDLDKRSEIVDGFNNSEDLSHRVMLVSLGCGGCNLMFFSLLFFNHY